MAWLAVFLFTFVVQFSGIEANRYDLDDTAGVLSIVLLILAIIVCIISLIVFFYIVYKLWNGDFGQNRNYYTRSMDRQKMVEQIDGGSRESSLNNKPVYSYHNEVAAAEEAREEAKITMVETTVVEDSFKSEEVIVNQAPPTDQAEMETQELVVVFDDNDDVIDVLTHVT